MITHEEMEEIFKKLRWETPACFDQNILNEANRWLNPKNSFRVFLYRQWRKTAGIAAMIGILVLSYFLFTESPTLTLGQVQAAVNNETWVHVKYDDGQEQWMNLREGWTFSKQNEGRIVFLNSRKGVRQVYWPELGHYISEDKIGSWKLSPTPWDAVVGHLEKNAKTSTPSSNFKVETCHEVINGRSVVRFDTYMKDALDKNVLLQQIWADPDTRLPVRIRDYLSLYDRRLLKREFITGYYDFPDIGPSSIYDLGAPRDLEIVKQGGKTNDPSVLEILEAGKKAYKNFPKKIRIINCVISRSAEIDIIYQNGLKYRGERFFNFIRSSPEYQKYHIDSTAAPEQVLEWSRSQIPISVHIGDGQKEFARNNSHPKVSNSGKTTVRVLRFDPRHPIPFADWPPQHQWTYAIAGGLALFEILTSAPDLPPGCIALRQTAGNIRREYYIDPNRNYSEIKELWWKKRNGNWEKDWEYTLSDYTQLPTGQWYATKLNLITYPDPEKGYGRGDTTWRIDIRILNETEFPPDTFNGEKLLQGAKIETY